MSKMPWKGLFPLSPQNSRSLHSTCFHPYTNQHQPLATYKRTAVFSAKFPSPSASVLNVRTYTELIPFLAVNITAFVSSTRETPGLPLYTPVQQCQDPYANLPASWHGLVLFVLLKSHKQAFCIQVTYWEIVPIGLS